MSCQHESYIVGCEACRVRQSRRRFFFGVAAAGVALALPKLPVPAADPYEIWYNQRFYHQVHIPTRNLLARIRITGPMIEASRHSSGAFLKAVEAEHAGIREYVRREEERLLMGGPPSLLVRTWERQEDGSYEADVDEVY